MVGTVRRVIVLVYVHYKVSKQKQKQKKEEVIPVNKENFLLNINPLITDHFAELIYYPLSILML